MTLTLPGFTQAATSADVFARLMGGVNSPADLDEFCQASLAALDAFELCDGLFIDAGRGAAVVEACGSITSDAADFLRNADSTRQERKLNAVLTRSLAVSRHFREMLTA